MKIRTLLTGIALVTASGTLAAQASYTDLGFSFRPSAISPDGTTMIGTGATGVELYDIATGTTTTLSGISPSPGAGGCLNDALLAAGTEDNMVGDTEAAQWDGNSWVTLGGLASQSGASVSSGYAISDDGLTVVGLGWHTAGEAHAFSWTQLTGMVDLGVPGESSRASGISGDGSTIAGFFTGGRRPCAWINGVFTPLGSLDAMDPAAGGEAWDASLDGSCIVGTSQDGVIGSQPFVWENGTMTGLGFLPGQSTGTAQAISADGEIIVGSNGSPFFGGVEGFIYDDVNGLQRLTDALTNAGAIVGPSSPGFVLGISADGTVMCGTTGGFPSGGWFAVLPRDLTPTTYCTGKVNTLGCTPAIGFTGTNPSASDMAAFDVTADMCINNKNGLFFYGTMGPANLPFQGGTLCVQPPLRRTAAQFSGGTAMGDDCSGTYSFALNALIQSGSDPFLMVGTTMNMQYWMRDPADANGIGLTNGLEAEIGM